MMTCPAHGSSQVQLFCLPPTYPEVPSGNQGALSPGGTSVRGLLWTLISFSAWHWNQSDVWVSGKEKLAGCP